MTDENNEFQPEMSEWQLVLLSVAEFIDAAGEHMAVKVDHVVEDLVYLAMATPADIGEELIALMLQGRIAKHEASNQPSLWTPETLSDRTA